ncbi:MAG: amidohydrolase family protein [Bacteroidetes bacterium]|nr:amidohydrolase family protein [Bacteroidota bacterium]
MRKIAANYIFPITKEPIKNGIIVVDDNGTITDIIDTKGEIKETENLEFYSGILVPGFVNSHCHLELSYLKKKIEKHKGLSSFVTQVRELRDDDEKNIIKALKKADNEMSANGIVAVGDISNCNVSFQTKKQSKISYHTFIESFGFDEKNAEKIFKNSVSLFNEINDVYGLNASLVPHSPYSVSNNLFNKISQFAIQNKSIISFHNQESEAENSLFLNKTGKLYERLKSIGINFSNWKPSGKSSLQSTLPHLPKQNKTLLIHNTFSNQQDIDFALNYFDENKGLFWVLCPNSNLYIENQLPDIELFTKNKLNIAIGTDSLSSNDNLSILDELKTINKKFPNIEFKEVIKWATINGAEALNFDSQLGSFDIGKKPGINLIENFDFQNMKLIDQSEVRVLV